MELDRQLLKEFAKITNDTPDTAKDVYLRGTVKVMSNGKFVQIDGSSNLTPISETVDVDEDDRVLVSIQNHKATIIGNFTFPPSARKEQEALDQAGNAQDTANNADSKANIAQQKAQDASDKADTAVSQSSIASASADEAKEKAQQAIESSNTANTNSIEAKEKALQAEKDATDAKTQASQAQANVADANAEIEKITTEVSHVKTDISDALDNLSAQAKEIQGVKETLSTEYSTKTETSEIKANLETEIIKKVGELQTTVSENYAAKSDVVDLEGKLQTQITQNAEGIATQVTKTEKLETDTAKAQEDVDKALKNAAAAQSTATEAKTNADVAKIAADSASASAEDAASKAEAAKTAAVAAQTAADSADKKIQQAQTDLNEAQKNLESITSDVNATKEDIADAQAKVQAAQTAVNTALADAAEANLAATNAQTAADKAKEDAATAQQTATNAQTKAEQAKTAADNAQMAADKAQADVAALTKRVTAAETNIEQTSEAIELNAKKTEEIGDSLKNNYYSKTDTDAAIKVESEKISSTVTQKVETEIGKIEIGGRNYYIGGNDEWSEWIIPGSGTNKIHSLNSLDLASLNLKADDVISLQMEFESQNFTNGSIITQGAVNSVWSGENYFDNPWTNLIQLSSLENLNKAKKYTKIYSFTQNAIAVINTIGGLIDLEFKVDNANSEGQYRYRMIKLERGNKVTDWSPAPEDVESDIAETERSLNERLDETSTKVTETQSSINQLANQITHLIVDENGSSMMTQTPDGWRFDMSSITGNIDSVKEALQEMDIEHAEVNGLVTGMQSTVDSIKNKTAYIDVGTEESTGKPKMTLGASDSQFRVEITNTAINFMQGSTVVAYASNNRFYAPQMVSVNSVQIGQGPGFRWEVRGNSNLGLIYVSS